MPGQFAAVNDLLPTALPSRRLEFHSPGARFSGSILQQYLPGGLKLFFEGEIDSPDAVYKPFQLDANRARPWSTLATRVNTAWTFTSGPPATDVEVLALPTVKISGNFDDTDRAKGGAPFTLRLSAGTQALARPSRVTVRSLEMSDDDGATWQAVRLDRDDDAQAVRLDRDDDGVRARLTNPAAGHGTGFVSLRVKASNAAGNTIEQTIIRAYGLT